MPNAKLTWAPKRSPPCDATATREAQAKHAVAKTGTKGGLGSSGASRRPISDRYSFDTACLLTSSASLADGDQHSTAGVTTPLGLGAPE
ncbi:MAG: hypothetical protein U0263_07165 [Polyangiaceae bacterium]